MSIVDKHRYLWWQTGVIYQIYPRSFQDANKDGIGDLAGVTQRLDYLEWLGVDAIWISPVYTSPMADFGYDIADYLSIDPLFGSMKDFDRLVEEVHRRNMKLVMDLVPNHTSDKHKWFIESRSSRDNPKRDWYIWRDPKPDGGPPTNWLSVFGGPAWEWDDDTGQYYYHAFLKEQPDLNWRNPEVRNAMFDVIRFWLDKGVDGFRVDVMWHMVKDDQFRDNPPNPDYQPGRAPYEQLLPVYSTDQPEVHDVVRGMRAVLEEYEERMMIGEIYLPLTRLVKYYGENNSGAHLPFNFQLLELQWEPERIYAAIQEYESILPEGGWPNWVIGNHDQPRVISRIGSAQAQVAALMLLTLRGTPTLYYGDEIGMADVAIPPEQFKDPQGLNMPGLNLSRDPSRTPMQWDDSQYGGFSATEPWLPLPPSFKRINVKLQAEAPYSMLNLYRRLLGLRRMEPALHHGDFSPVHCDRQAMAYIRRAGNTRFMVVLNLSHRPYFFQPESFPFSGTIVLSTIPERDGALVENSLTVSGDEGLLIRLNDEQA